MVQERRTCLDTVRHSHPVDLHQQIIRQPKRKIDGNGSAQKIQRGRDGTSDALKILSESGISFLRTVSEQETERTIAEHRDPPENPEAFRSNDDLRQSIDHPRNTGRTFERAAHRPDPGDAVQARPPWQIKPVLFPLIVRIAPEEFVGTLA
ncbi:MAG: hypothetical protein IPI01_21040 [Ignavibacteriae bacterium]|nr:hypothetical protein [Ignavibacteriota bacterium]